MPNGQVQRLKNEKRRIKESPACQLLCNVASSFYPNLCEWSSHPLEYSSWGLAPSVTPILSSVVQLVYLGLSGWLAVSILQPGLYFWPASHFPREIVKCAGQGPSEANARVLKPNRT